MLRLKRSVNCSRRMVVYAIFDVLDRMGCQYEQAMVGDIRVETNVLGHISEYAFAVTEQTANTSILHVSMLRPASGMTEEKKTTRGALYVGQCTPAYRRSAGFRVRRV